MSKYLWYMYVYTSSIQMKHYHCQYSVPVYQYELLCLMPIEATS